MKFIDTHFTEGDVWFLAIGGVLVLLSIFFFATQKHKSALFFLIAGAFVLRLWMAFIDPFLNQWDEQYHALVAKNMATNFWHPMLYKNPMLRFSEDMWISNHTWLHKPPLFLWQMALSIKLFGATYWSIRIPSVLLTTALVPVIYRMGFLLKNKQVAFLSALFYACSCLLINVVSGGINTDHNDVIFMCYVVFSFWTFVEYTSSEKWIHALFTGIFVAAAILVKWLPGLLVFSAWFFWLIFSKNKRTQIQYWLHLFVAGIIAIALPATWFISAYFKWPVEFAVTMDLYSKHINDDLAHPGVWYYHFQYYYDNFGWLIVAFFFVGAIFSMKQKTTKNGWISIFISILITFLFYTLVLTRMPLMCLIVMPLTLLFVALVGNEILNLINKIPKKAAVLITFLTLTIAAFSILNYGEIERVHSFRDDNIYRKSRMHNQKILIETAEQLKKNNYAILLNCGYLGNGVITLYYTDLLAYDKIPDEDEFNTLRKNKIKAAIFDDGRLPDFITKNDSILILPDKLLRTGM